MSESDIKEELEFLRWFFQEADFGPAHGDVMFYMKQKWKEKTGRTIPYGYDEE